MNICLKLAEVPCGIANTMYGRHREMFGDLLRYQIKDRDGFLNLVLYMEFEDEADLVIFLLTYNEQLNKLNKTI